MRIRKLTVFLLGLVLSAGLACGQEAGQDQGDNAAAAQSAPPAQRRLPDPARQARRLGRQLGLSADQVSQIEAILAARQQHIEKVRTDPTLLPRQRRMRVGRIMRESNSKMEALMSDSQKQQYRQILQARREARRQRMRQQQAAPPQAPQQQEPQAETQQQ